jgi:diguanylate cyclase (GGDEF)-like protein
VQVQVGWAVAAALVLALAAVAAIGAAGRRRLERRGTDLSKALELRTTELESARLQLQRLGTEDALTGLATHGMLQEFLEREWRRARREGLPLSLIFIDIDQFRGFNRQFGREAGDDLLKRLSRALTALVGRPGDLVARYRNDEFAVVMASTDVTGAFQISEQVRKSLEELRIPAAEDAPQPHVTASVALATAIPQRESAWEELDLIKAARHALREAKSAGGNRVMRANLGMAGPPELVTRF